MKRAVAILGTWALAVSGIVAITAQSGSTQVPAPFSALPTQELAGYSTGTGNRLTTDGTYNYAYDADGNLTSKTQISNGNKTLYTYDFRSRLTEVDSVVAGVISGSRKPMRSESSHSIKGIAFTGPSS